MVLLRPRQRGNGMSRRRLAVFVALYFLAVVMALVSSGGSTGPSGAPGNDASRAGTHGARPDGSEAEHREGPGVEADVEGPEDWFVAQRVVGSGIPAGAPAAAARQADRLAAQTAAQDPRLAAAPWQPVGPTNIGGRILDLALDPSDPQTLYAAAA